MLVYKSTLQTASADYGGLSVQSTVSGVTRLQIPVDLQNFVTPAFSPDGTINSGGVLFTNNLIPSGA